MLKFPEELKGIKYGIEAYARAFGLDFFPVIFEVLDYQQMNEVAAYGGFPRRYPHWRFGMQYDELSKSYRFGLSKIYEMVINTDPCYAYLLHCNDLIDQKLVMAHVFAHCDFFKNNLYFAHTNRKMIDEMANHATRIQRYVDRYGNDVLEFFIDCCLSLENLIDPHYPFMKRHEDQNETEWKGTQSQTGQDRRAQDAECASSFRDASRGAPGMDDFGDEEDDRIRPKRLVSKDYMDAYVNPPEFLKARADEMKARRRQKKRFPENPDPDVLLFLIENAPLKNWQRDVLSIIREEAYYFLPQAQTKIMNEGWATYWHSRIMTERVLRDKDVIDYADHHSGTLAGTPFSLNPYKIGLELFRDIEDRWNKGRFGKEYEECKDLAEREQWDRKTGLGREKIFEVRRLHNDLTFLDTFLTDDFCRAHNLFVYEKDNRKQAWVIKSVEFAEIKEALLQQLTNLGHPIIRVEDGNFQNRGELLLVHEHEGRDLKWDFVRETLNNLYRVWKRGVVVETKRVGKTLQARFDSQGYREAYVTKQ
ncbi:MAG: SpoVR family protein [Syntrophorhabdales bacterium]